MTSDEAQNEAIRRIRHCQETGQIWLDLGDLQMDELPAELGNCNHLQFLALGNKKLIVQEQGITFGYELERTHQEFIEIGVLKGLTQLRTLDLSWCIYLENVDVLQELTQLTTLHLSGCENLENVDGLQGLTKLTNLKLYNCHDLENFDGLQGLRQLNDLNLAWCKNLENVDVLQGLTQLTTLYLTGCKNLENVDGLQGLKQLTTLNLFACENLENVDVLQGLTKLTTLHLSFCFRVQAFKPVISILDYLKELKVYNTRFQDLHPAVCGSDYYENSIANVQQYYAALGPDAQPDAEIKVYILGNGRAGKSYLLRRILGESFEDINRANIQTTHGVQIATFDTPQDWSLPHPVKLCFWDFGGQDIYHGTHALFLREPAIYLLLTCRATENTDELSDNGFVIKNRRLEYWFDYLRQEAGHDGTVNSPVLLIESQCDKYGEHGEPDSRPTQDEFPHLSPIIHTNAKDDDGLDLLLPRLKRAIKDLLHAHPQPPLPTSWANVRQVIRDMQRSHIPRTLTQEEFAELCEKHQVVPEHMGTLREALHLMGAVFYRQGLFGDRIIVDQGWVLENIYDLCKRDELFQKQLRRQNGRFARSDLERFVWQEKMHSIEDQKLFLSFMVECGICFVASGDADEDTAEYIAPDLLSTDHTGLKNWIRLAERDAIGVSVAYGLLHDGIIRNFLSRIGALARDIADYWKYGCHLYDAKSESDVLIRTEENSIRLQAWGERPKQLLVELLKELARVPGGQPPSVIWDENKESPTILEPSEKENEKAAIYINPSLGPKSVFFSYRHPNSAVANSERGRQLLIELEAILTAEGWQVRFDIRDIEQGDSISRFMTEVRACTFFVPIFCERYLASRYTLSELFTFREKFAHDSKAFADRTMTVVFPESGIQDDIEQAKYVLKCTTMFDEYFEMAGKKALAPQTYTEVVYLNSWAGRLSEILASLSDRLNNPTAEDVAKRLNRVFAEQYPDYQDRKRFHS
ncbi:MAG: COR domain-containing protein [Zavarzinella sp.]